MTYEGQVPLEQELLLAGEASLGAFHTTSP